MNIKLTALCLFLCLYCIGQQKTNTKNNYGLTAGFALLSGAADGFNQALSFRYDAVDSKLHLPAQFWNPAISWQNKYKGNDIKRGAKFPGSKGPFVFLTDGYHLTRFASNLFNAGAVAIQFSGQKRKWYYYVIKGISYWTVNRIGFSITYNILK
jgi:hypothetical protein